jgi:stage II sporulation protein GA (sporulation sigma-E factor processing peptidase)
MLLETAIYVDVLLVINYGISLLLIASTAKLAGRKCRGRRIVAAALLGAVSSLAIFLPLHDFFSMLLLRLGISAGIVLVAFRPATCKVYLREWFLFFAVTFTFAGAMLGLWMLLRPSGMVYYNGIVYFDIPPALLMATTMAVYFLLELSYRLARKGRIKQEFYRVVIREKGRSVALTGLVDTGNSLYEPFSGIPVIVASLERLASILPPGTPEALLGGKYEAGEDCGMTLRGIPCGHVGGSGILPAFRPERLTLTRGAATYEVERCYVAISLTSIGDERYDALLHPGLIGFSDRPMIMAMPLSRAKRK